MMCNRPMLKQCTIQYIVLAQIMAGKHDEKLSFLERQSKTSLHCVDSNRTRRAHQTIFEIETLRIFYCSISHFNSACLWKNSRGKLFYSVKVREEKCAPCCIFFILRTRRQINTINKKYEKVRRRKTRYEHINHTRNRNDVVLLVVFFFKSFSFPSAQFTKTMALARD